MDTSPKSFSVNNTNTTDNPLKNHAVKILRRILLAIILAVAILSVGWFIYGHFFKVNEQPKTYTADKAGILQYINDTSKPVSDAARLQTIDMMERQTTTNFKPVTKNTNGEVQNTTPLSIREQVLQSMQQGK